MAGIVSTRKYHHTRAKVSYYCFERSLDPHSPYPLLSASIANMTVALAAVSSVARDLSVQSEMRHVLLLTTVRCVLVIQPLRNKTPWYCCNCGFGP
jgi:hypothetical protein